MVARAQGMSVQTTAKSTIYPLADDLEAYNRAIPNGAERLFANFDSQTQHRIAIENSLVKSNIRQAERGQILGFSTGVLALVTALVAALFGHDQFAGVIVFVVLAGGCSIFITSQVQQRKDLEKKKQTAREAGAQ